MDGYPIVSSKVNDVDVQVQQLHVGAAYSVPSLFSGWRYANNTGHALDQATADIESGDSTHQKGLHDMKNPTRSGSPEHLFAMRQKIEDLEAQLAKK